METPGPSETCSVQPISVQILSVKGLHYALRIWTRQIFGLVIMMLYPLPPQIQVLHQVQCSCIPEMFTLPPISLSVSLSSHKPSEKKWKLGAARNTTYHINIDIKKERKQSNRRILPTTGNPKMLDEYVFDNQRRWVLNVRLELWGRAHLDLWFSL